MISTIDKKLARQKLYVRASETELSIAQSWLIRANEDLELARNALNDAERDSAQVLDKVNQYVSNGNLCPMRLANLHQEFEKKVSAVEQCELKREQCIDDVEKAQMEYRLKRAQSNAFITRKKKAEEQKYYVVNQVEDGNATELHNLRTRSDK